MQDACFIVSFDCEGKWGFADRIGEYHDRWFSNANLLRAYQDILQLLNQHEMKATFAFVSAFTLELEEFREHQALFSDRQFGGANWLARFKQQVVVQGNADGWFCPQAFAAVQASPQHEIATHGFTHLPFDEAMVNRDDIRKELDGIRTWADWKGVDLSTLIFPRNRVGFTDLLAEAGIRAYRDTPLYYGLQPRWKAELLRYTQLQVSEPHAQVSELLKIPGGSLLAFRRKFRIPPDFMVVKRWQAMIDHAVAHGQVVHVWMHPHNMIDGLGQKALFDQVLAHAASHIRAGRLRNLTQHEYWSAVSNG